MCLSTALETLWLPRSEGYRRHLAITVYLSCELQGHTSSTVLHTGVADCGSCVVRDGTATRGVAWIQSYLAIGNDGAHAVGG